MHALARANTPSDGYLLRIRLGGRDELSVASATSRRLADSDVRFLKRRTSDVARERAVRHPALDWLLCLVNRNSWAAERRRWWRRRRPLLQYRPHRACAMPAVAVTWSGTVTWSRTADDAHTRAVAFKLRTRNGIWSEFGVVTRNKRYMERQTVGMSFQQRMRKLNVKAFAVLNPGL